MTDFSDHQYTLERLADAQAADHDNREKAREAKLFVTKRDGQWEPYWWNQFTGQPRYTFDLTSPAIDGISGEIKKADFDIKVSPAGGDASKEDAKTLDGLIRNIENISNATHIFGAAAKSMITTGLGGWRVNTKYVDDNSMDQDIVIESIPNFIDRAWLGPHTNQDGSDMKFGFVLQAIPKLEYEKKWPDGDGQSVGDDKQGNAYYYKENNVVVGEVLYIKEEMRDLVQMSNGKTYVVDDDFEAVADDLAKAGITELKRRERPDRIVYSRKFDGGGWLEKEVETIFSYIPIIPTYGNFDIFEDKVIYWGKVEKMIDSQRVLNYAKSREISEGALSPRAKYWMTRAQAEGEEDTLATLNTNNDPVQFYTPDGELPGPPQQNGGAVINQGLLATSQSMQEMIVRTGGQTAPGMGEQINNQSGVAIERLQAKGDIGSIDYFESQEIAISHTGKIILDAVPKIYDVSRIVRILGEDGTSSMVTLYEQVPDQQTGEMKTLNDISKGVYDLTCSSGPSFQNRQQETQAGIIEMAAIDPTIIQEGGDILFANTNAPGMDQLAERKRVKLFNAGAIPFEQMTEDEKEQFQQMQQQQAEQGQQPDAMMVAAQAEMAKAQAENEKNQINMQKQQMEFQIKSATTQLAQQKQQIDLQEKMAKFELDQQKFIADKARQDAELMMKQAQQQRDFITQALTDENTDADTVLKLKQGYGITASQSEGDGPR